MRLYTTSSFLSMNNGIYIYILRAWYRMAVVFLELLGTKYCCLWFWCLQNVDSTNTISISMKVILQNSIMNLGWENCWKELNKNINECWPYDKIKAMSPKKQAQRTRKSVYFFMHVSVSIFFLSIKVVSIQWSYFGTHNILLFVGNCLLQTGNYCIPEWNWLIQ